MGWRKGGGIATGDDLVAHLRSLRDGATRLLWLDPSWGTKLGGHFAGSVDVL